MFEIVQSDKYQWPVKVSFPADGGRIETQTFDALFKRLSKERLSQIREAITAGETTDEEIVDEVLVGWSNVTSGGVQVTYSLEAKRGLVAMPLVAGHIVRSFFESLAEAARKN